MKSKLVAAFILFLAIILSSVSIAAAAETNLENTVEITVSTNKSEASVLFDYFKNNGYEIVTNEKNKIVVAKKVAKPAISVTTEQSNQTLASGISNSVIKQYVQYGLGGGLLILILMFLVSKLIKGRQSGYQEELYYETFPEYSYNESNQQFDQQRVNLFQRIGEIQVQPQYTSYYYGGNNYGYQTPVVKQQPCYNPYVVQYGHCDDNSQFNIIRQRHM